MTYLQSENKYADKWFSSKHNYKTEIVNELIEQLPEEEVSFPLYNNGYLYYEKLNKGDAFYWDTSPLSIVLIIWSLIFFPWHSCH